MNPVASYPSLQSSLQQRYSLYRSQLKNGGLLLCEGFQISFAPSVSLAVWATSIGRRYERYDELGTPSGFTINFQSLKDNTFTLRDRDTMKQVRASEEEICKAIGNLTEGTETWQDVAMRLPAFKRQKVDKINPASELYIIRVPCG